MLHVTAAGNRQYTLLISVFVNLKTKRTWSDNVRPTCTVYYTIMFPSESEGNMIANIIANMIANMIANTLSN